MMATASEAKPCRFCEEQSYCCPNCSKHHGVAKATRKHKCPDGNILESLRTIEVTKKQTEITPPKPNHKVAQLLVPSDSIRVDKIAEIDLSGTVSNAKIEDCCFTADDMILLSDSKNNQIIVLGQHGNYLRTFKLDKSPNKVINFKNYIVVSFCLAKAIRKLNISNGKILNEVTFDTECKALAVAGDRIIVHFCNKKYTICDQSLNIVGTIPVLGDCTLYFRYYDNKIFLPRWTEDAVFCYSMEGDLVWKCHDKSLKSPTGIAIGKHGYLFVAGYYSSNIFAISQDGATRKELLNLQDVMTNPFAISLNPNLNRLLLTSDRSSKIFIYDLKNC